MGFGLIKNAIVLTEIADERKAAILQKVQHILARDLAVHTSFRALYNFFLGMDPHAPAAADRLPAEDDKELLQDLKQHGYDLHGDFHDNAKFWNGILTPQEYEIVTSHHLPHAEEDEAEVYAGADAGEYSSLANIGAVEGEEENEESDWREPIRRRAYDLVNQRFQQDQEETEYEEDTEAMEPESHPLYPHVDKTNLPSEMPRHEEPKPEGVPYASFEQEEDVTGTIDPHDYQEWMRAIHEEGNARSVNINVKRNFEDLAFELLDNDPKLDAVGSNEDNKAGIVKMLWHQHRAMVARKKASATFKSFARPEENEEYEEVSGAFQQAQDACLDHWRGNVRGVPKNPYAKGTKRHGQWEKGWESAEHGVWDKRHVPAREEEESGFAQQFRVNNDLPASYEHEEDTKINPVMKLKPVGRTFSLQWKSGKTETVQGNDIADAFTNAGYGPHAIQALDHYKEVYNNKGGMDKPARLGHNVDTYA